VVHLLETEPPLCPAAQRRWCVCVAADCRAAAAAAAPAASEPTAAPGPAYCCCVLGTWLDGY